MAKPIITAKLHGVRQIQKMARNQNVTVTRSLEKAFERITRDIAALARALIQHNITGRLRRSTRARQIEPKRWQVVAGNRKAFYAHFVERGTYRTREKAFLRPAFEAYRDKINERIRKAVMAGLKQAASGRKRGKAAKEA